MNELINESSVSSLQISYLPSPPLGVFAFLVVVLHLGPDVVKVIKQLFGLVAAPVDGNGQ